MLVVPFGRRRVKAVVVGLAETSEVPEAQLAEPLEALEAGVPPELVELGRWVGEEYCSTPARGLGLTLPPGIGSGAEARSVQAADRARGRVDRARASDAVNGGEVRLGLRQRAVLRALAAGPQSARATWRRRRDRIARRIRRLEERGLRLDARGRAAAPARRRPRSGPPTTASS